MKLTQPRTLLPETARKRLIDEAESIRRCYKQPVLRMQALDMVIDRIKEEYPGAFIDAGLTSPE